MFKSTNYSYLRFRSMSILAIANDIFTITNFVNHRSISWKNSLTFTVFKEYVVGSEF